MLCRSLERYADVFHTPIFHPLLLLDLLCSLCTVKKIKYANVKGVLNITLIANDNLGVMR